MKSYPSIDKRIPRGVSVFVFPKFDGSNVRAEWTRKRGFFKFGRRTGLLYDSNPWMKEVRPLILERYQEDLSREFRKRKWEKATAFFEFYGPGSFAGNHLDEPHTVILIDVSVHRKGFLELKEFCKIQADLPEVIHHGPLDEVLIEQIKEGQLPGATFEGVVCKGPWDRKEGRPLMFKIKTRQWLAELKSFCKGDENLFKRLS